MKVFIVGVNGFLGKTLALDLISKDYNVVGSGRAKEASIENMDYVSCDLEKDKVNIPKNTDIIFYLAQSPFYRNFPEGAESLIKVNAIAPLEIAKQAQEQGVKAFFYASTGNVYSPSFEALSESHPVSNYDAYSLSKNTGEQLLSLLSGDMQIINLRIFGLFGPNQEKMLPYFLYNAVKTNTPISLQGQSKGENKGLMISYLFTKDACNILESLAVKTMQRIKLPNVINVAGKEVISIKQFAETVSKVLMINSPPLFTFSSALRKCDLNANITLLKELLSPSFTPFEEAVKQSYSSSL